MSAAAPGSRWDIAVEYQVTEKEEDDDDNDNDDNDKGQEE